MSPDAKVAAPQDRHPEPAATKPSIRPHPTAGDRQAAAAERVSVNLSPAETDEFTTALDGAYAVVVLGAAGRYRRRVFLTLASAERAVARARERGQSSRIVLAELKPLYNVEAGR